jgi:biotin operon repressor
VKEKKFEITHRELGWAIRELFDDRLKFGHRHILKTAYLCLDKNFQFKWSQKELARVTGMGKSTVREKQTDLEKWGYFILIKPGSNLTHEPHLYQINTRVVCAYSVHKLFKAAPESGIGLRQKTEISAPESGSLASAKEAIGEPPPFEAGVPPLDETKQRQEALDKMKLLNQRKKERQNAKS